MQTSLKVIKRRPKDRSRPEGLAGRLNIKLRSCSLKLGDPCDSYLHVGTETLRISFDKSLLQYTTGAKGRRELEELVNKISKTISLEHKQFSATRVGLVIPGGSVKGNIRSRLELSFIPKNDEVRSCFITAKNPIDSSARGTQGWRHRLIWQQALSVDREEACSCEVDWEDCEVCLTCDLFGSAGLQGLISFEDLVGVNTSPVPLDLPTGEKLEAVAPGSHFKGAVTFKNLEPVELGLLLYGMGIRNSRVGRPVLFGKLKYRRDLPYIFGVVRYELENVELAPFSQTLQIGNVRLPPSTSLEGEKLDEAVTQLVDLVIGSFSGELIDVDEVGAVEQLTAQV
ncbi:MAG: RAMP superfamily CRISPR-associated protein [Thermofilaceae archaeon]|nr:RAMP superfamily CRISPR-associated protein [Thermofilaceae archaeon]MDW8004930.1 RAMP superfamily CRISPR-associated protein [Thermofilaceae archaeon]